MTPTNDQAINKLNLLLGTCIDSQKGYQEAAEETKSAEHRRLFEEYAAQRAQFASELTAEIRALGGEPKERGSAGAALHRAWLNVRDAVTGKGDTAILAECERGENVALENYQDAFEADLPSSTRQLVEQQRTLIEQAKTTVQSTPGASL